MPQRNITLIEQHMPFMVDVTTPLLKFSFLFRFRWPLNFLLICLALYFLMEASWIGLEIWFSFVPEPDPFVLIEGDV